MENELALNFALTCTEQEKEKHVVTGVSTKLPLQTSSKCVVVSISPQSMCHKYTVTLKTCFY